MARGREGDLRVRGLGLGVRFMLTMTAALSLVMIGAAALLFGASSSIAERAKVESISRAVKYAFERGERFDEGELGEWIDDGPGMEDVATGVRRFPVLYGKARRPGTVYQYKVVDPNTRESEEFRMLVPGRTNEAQDMLKLIAGITLAVVAVGALVALWAGKQVAQPIDRIIDDVRQIAKGNLEHKTRASGGGELSLLARSIDRMTRDLQHAQSAQVELSVREREMGLAAGVREALMPLATPHVAGYDVGAVHISSGRIGGDFHDFVELEDGRFGCLVCDVSGTGVPASLVGTTTRSYLRSELSRGGDVAEAFGRVNRWLAEDVRRGMYATALYVLVDPAAARFHVACAGHKLPLVRITASDGQLRVVHPEGIALGFDKGPVFEKRLDVQEHPFEPGDRLFLSNSMPVTVRNAEDRELGEKAFFGRILKYSRQDAMTFLKSLRKDLERFAGERRIPGDVSLVTIDRLNGDRPNGDRQS